MGEAGDHEVLMIEALKEFRNVLNELESSLRDVEDSEAIIKGALDAARGFYQADRAYVLEIDTELHVGVNTYECGEETEPAAETSPQRIPLELIPRLEQALKQNQPLIIRDVEDIRQNYPSE